MKKYFSILLCLIIVNSLANAQFFKNTSIALGLSTSQILGNNPGGKPMLPSSDADPAISGGGFLGAQPGIDFRMTIPVDNKQRWRIPVGVDYQFFSAKERVPRKYIEIKLNYSFNIISPYIGVSYVLQDLYMIKSKTYASLEARASFINQLDYKITYQYLLDHSLDTTRYPRTKGNATRLGGMARIGVESYLFYPIQINASVGASLMNLIGRDDKRYELLTPISFMEVKESFVWNLNFSIMFQYTF
ncbi:MAG TPA: hypothetical protein PLC04_03565 [Candidatus Kapabacteria bacterium]|nr:hypothetical protein [Candidatus Kapabacteria bacterium]HOV92141.1 hypothetical protein [Candidatus Kapabacteria bacterium]